MADAREDLVRIALEGMRFPAGHHEVMTYATDRGGIEPDVLDALGTLPSRAFSGPDDVVISLPDRT
ncbi:DUF2795 domain-containing protein [Actinomycetospora cinnamomea]|uniref:Uncharacterized protein DUF2795 n=1 Tax=Actinomycetospora cinnamomea TaxID=663609 RepID=A0A2U1F7I0_9PSEU|nr:DUF2795 domain-containing protein [Actinomycetospora cinnamomea]PVZ08143.1 uncharacterized protein DUF2795 [Actinomycetospora cinnamomea]